ncbi:DUF4124 domain-containing protein [Granulosicoccus sp.]|nr:DUF4124 domain-containing protein [Granulosicoccus sp.]
MIRPLIFCTLLSASICVLAQPLYKWVEADGSITFSVKRPPAGVDYETINASAEKETKTPAAADSVSAQKAPTMQQMLPGAQPSEPGQRLAPQLGIQAGNRNSSGEQNDAQNAQPAQATSKPDAGSASDTSRSISDRAASLSAKSRKQRQCEDLKKRVISLERRLKSRLTPDDMDNTVVHMARYQRSYDHHCVQ